jgi:hypothetical protein
MSFASAADARPLRNGGIPRRAWCATSPKRHESVMVGNETSSERCVPARIAVTETLSRPK